MPYIPFKGNTGPYSPYIPFKGNLNKKQQNKNLTVPRIAQNCPKAAQNRIPILPIGSLRKPGYLGSQLERRIEEKQRKTVEEQQKNDKHLLKKALKMPQNIPLGFQLEAL